LRRAWAVLPGLVALGAPRVDLLELGASGGLLLAFDRYEYHCDRLEWLAP